MNIIFLQLLNISYLNRVNCVFFIPHINNFENLHVKIALNFKCVLDGRLSLLICILNSL